MSATPPANSGTCVVDQSASEHLLVQLSPEADRCVVWVTGELDAASRDQLIVAASACDHPVMVIDLAGVTFMDCSGYGALAASRFAVERDGRRLTTRGQTGQPGRLFEMIATLEDQR